jgi:hypothetical protein
MTAPTPEDVAKARELIRTSPYLHVEGIGNDAAAYWTAALGKP